LLPGLTFLGTHKSADIKEMFEHPDCNTFITDAPDDILAAARKRVAARRQV
jgi:hypothetical protein